MGALSDVPILGAAGGEIKCWITGGCFAAGTPVVMQDDTTKPIEAVVQGDQVLSKDEKTGRMEARGVEQVSRRTVGRVVRVTLTDPVTHQSQTITATEDHPFYVQGKGFVPAGQLGIGTSIVTRAGPALTVSGSALLPEQVGGYVVYNLTVEGDHTYFVGSVDGGAWVHNFDCNSPGWVNSKGAFLSWARECAEKPKVPLTSEEADNLVQQVRNWGVEVSADAHDLAGHPNTPWNIPHVHFEPDGIRLHIPVPSDYNIPAP